MSYIVYTASLCHSHLEDTNAFYITPQCKNFKINVYRTHSESAYGLILCINKSILVRNIDKIIHLTREITKPKGANSPRQTSCKLTGDTETTEPVSPTRTIT